MLAHDSNIAWDLFVGKLNALLDIHAPFENVRIPESMPKWVTREFLQACDEHNYHLRQYRRNRAEDNRNRMKCSRNFVTWLKQTEKGLFSECDL